MITIHILTSNGSVVDTSSGKTLGHMVASDDDSITVVNHFKGTVTEYYVLAVTSVTKTSAHEVGVTVNVEPITPNSFGQIASDWAEDNTADWSYSD
jgi:hypothetical protein